MSVEGESHLVACLFPGRPDQQGNELEEGGLGGGKFEEVELLELHH